MSRFREFARGVARATGNSRLDRLCRENGWNIDERRGKAIILHFNGDQITPQRSIIAVYDDGDPAMTISGICRAEFRAHNTPDDLLGALLVRNSGVAFGAWTASVDDGEVTLTLQYRALASAVDAALFRVICTLIIKEVAEVEAHLHRRGLL